jgi:nitrogen regulatory protein PII
MKLIKAIIRPNKLEGVKDALNKISVAGLTVTEVHRHGRQQGHRAVYRGAEYAVTLLLKLD